MRLRSTLPLLATLILTAPVVAQNAPNGPAPAPPPPAVAPAGAAVPAGSSNLPVTTVSSHIRSFDTGPDGQVSSLYLRDGRVVNLSPDLGRQLTGQARKGARIRVTGASSTMNGQRILFANQVTLNSQTFTSQQPGGPDANGPIPGSGPGVPPPPGPAGSGIAPPPPPPPPPGGPMAAPGRRPGGSVPPPPPPPPGNGAVPPPPTPVDPQNAPAQPAPPAVPNGAAAPAPQAPSL